MAGLIDQYVQLGEELVKTTNWSRRQQTHPFEITMNHPIFMEVDQPLSDAD